MGGADNFNFVFDKEHNAINYASEVNDVEHSKDAQDGIFGPFSARSIGWVFRAYIFLYDLTFGFRVSDLF